MNKNNNKMDLLGNAPVPQALMALGIPIMIGMLINALYNLVDAYFIGGLGESQMGAISIAFPLGQVVVGLGLMFGNGAASYLSRLLGRGDREAASKVASTALYSSVCIGAVIIIGTAIFLKPILTMLGATDTIMPYRDDFCRSKIANGKWIFLLRIWILHSVFFSVSCTWKRHRRIRSWGLPTRYLLCSDHSVAPIILGHKWNTICTTDCRCNFCYCYCVYGSTSS